MKLLKGLIALACAYQGAKLGMGYGHEYIGGLLGFFVGIILVDYGPAIIAHLVRIAAGTASRRPAPAPAPAVQYSNSLTTDLTRLQSIAQEMRGNVPLPRAEALLAEAETIHQRIAATIEGEGRG